MANPAIQVTMWMREGDYGWSEVHYLQPLDGVLVDFVRDKIQQLSGLCTLRSQLLNTKSKLLGARCSVVNVWRDSAFFDVGGNTDLYMRFASPYGDDAIPASPYAVTTVRIEAGTSYRKLVYLSGVPAQSQDPNNPGVFQKDFQANYDKYFKFLTSAYAGVGVWGTLVRTKSVANPPVPNLTNPVLAQGVAPAKNTISFTYTPRDASDTVVPTKGGAFRILGVTGDKADQPRKWNGDFKIVSYVGNTITVTTKIQTTDLGNLNFGKAYGWTVGQDFKQYTSYSFEGLTHRKRGRPFGLPRGRASTRP